MRVEDGFWNKKKEETCKSREICEKNKEDVREPQILESNPKNADIRELLIPTASAYYLVMILNP